MPADLLPTDGMASVMVVEDEFLIAMDLQAILEQNGYRVVGPALSVGHALRLLEADPPDVAVLDVNVRGEIVTPVATALERAAVPFLLTSAHGASELARLGLDARARNAGKPIEPQRLLAALADLGRGSATKP